MKVIYSLFIVCFVSLMTSCSNTESTEPKDEVKIIEDENLDYKELVLISVSSLEEDDDCLLEFEGDFSVMFCNGENHESKIGKLCRIYYDRKETTVGEIDWSDGGDYPYIVNLKELQVLD
jgi:hypothetical protein